MTVKQLELFEADVRWFEETPDLFYIDFENVSAIDINKIDFGPVRDFVKKTNYEVRYYGRLMVLDIEEMKGVVGWLIHSRGWDYECCGFDLIRLHDCSYRLSFSKTKSKE